MLEQRGGKESRNLARSWSEELMIGEETGMIRFFYPESSTS